jgi:hypothetical protein
MQNGEKMSLIDAIHTVRNSVCAVLRIRPTGKNQADGKIVGSAWCVVDNKYLVTANHIFNDSQKREPTDRFYVFTVPNNEGFSYHALVTSFLLENAMSDMAIIEIDSSANKNFYVTDIPITLRQHQDGEQILTMGFPEPVLERFEIDDNFNYVTGAFFLKSHANEGIISAQYEMGDHFFYEFNTGWFPGESGGPIVSMEPLAAFSIMQQTRDINTKHGVIPGPCQGRSLSMIEDSLQLIGANII